MLRVVGKIAHASGVPVRGPKISGSEGQGGEMIIDPSELDPQSVYKLLCR